MDIHASMHDPRLGLPRDVHPLAQVPISLRGKEVRVLLQDAQTAEYGGQRALEQNWAKGRL